MMAPKARQSRTKPDHRPQGPAACGRNGPNASASGPTSNRFDFSAGCVIVAITIVAYIPALRAGFVWDDDDYVTENMALRSVEGLGEIWTSNLEAVARVLDHWWGEGDLEEHGRRLGRGETSQYYPATYTTFWIEYQIWRLNALGYHLMNVFLHATAAVLLWIVLRRLAVPGAWLAAAIFAVHPVHVESVAWITERKNVLSIVFYLVALLAYMRYARLDGLADPPRRPKALYIVSLALFLLALLSKTAVVALPAVILLLIWWKRDRLRARDILPVLPMFAIAVAMGMVTILVEQYNVGAESEPVTLSILGRCILAGRVLCFYVAKLIGPVNTTFIYYRWPVDPGIWWWYLYPAAVIGIIVALWVLRRRIGKGPLVAALYFAGSLVPVLGFLGVYFMRYSYVADHFQYVAGIGPIALFAASIVTFLRIRPWGTDATAQPNVRWLPPAAYLVALAVLTWNQCKAYENAETLWRDTLRKNPTAWIAHNNLGNILVERGEIEDALAHFREAIELAPDYSEAHTGMGIVLARQGKLDEAIDHFRERLRLKSGSPMAHTNVALALARTGQAEEARRHFDLALAMEPEYLDAHRGLAVLLARQGRFGDAIAQFRDVARLDPDDAEAQFQLGNLFQRVGRLDDAREAFRAALAIAPHHARAQQALNSLPP